MSKHPDVEVRILDGVYPTVLPLVREGVFDFTVGPAPPDLAVGEFEVDELFETELLVVGRVGHPKAKTKRLADLVSAQWITLGPSGGPGDYFVNAFIAQGLDAPKAKIKSESFASSLALIESSDFLSIWPQRLIAQMEKSNRLQALAVTVPMPAIKVVLMRRAGVPLTPAAEALAVLVRRRANTIAGSARKDR